MCKKYVQYMILALPFIMFTGTGRLFSQEQLLFDIYAFDADTAVTVGVGGTVWKTENGGRTWEAKYTGSEILRGVTFQRTTGWVVGDNTILKSTDRGKTWTRLSPPSARSFFSVSFVDSLTGWLSTGLDTLYKTIDGGQDWKAILIDSSHSFFLEAVDFVDPDTGWAVGDAIAKSTDGGQTWTIQNCDTPLGACPGGIYDVFALDGTNAWAVGLDSTIFHTTNGGETWTIEVRESRWSPTSSVLNSVHFVDSQTGWIAGGRPGVILKTVDGGQSWDKQFNDPERSLDLKSVHSLSPDVAWAVGSKFIPEQPRQPVILRTIDGGQTWENLSDNIVSVEHDETGHENTPNEFRLYQNYPNPFNPETIISYTLARMTPVRIYVYNLKGQRVTTLVNEVQRAGDYSVAFDAGHLPSGVYVYELETYGLRQTRKMLLLR